MTCARGPTLSASATASAPEPVHRSTITGVPAKAGCRSDPFQQRLGLRARDEHPGPDVRASSGPNGADAGQVLQRHPARPRVDELAVAVVERSSGSMEPQQAAVDAGDVRGEELGVDAARCRCPACGERAGAASSMARRRPRHRAALCSLACLSAAASASNIASSSPSRTWSRLCALKPMRWSVIRFSG